MQEIDSFRMHLAQPPPPADPAEALELARAWDYAPTLEGYCRAGVALLLAEAVELWRPDKT